MSSRLTCSTISTGSSALAPRRECEWRGWPTGRGAAPASMNRRVAAVRGLFEYAVISGFRADNPVPAARRSTGLRAKRRGPLGHIGPGRPSTGGRLIRESRRLPESLDREEISGFLADLIPYGGWLVKGVGGGALVRPGPPRVKGAARPCGTGCAGP